MDKLIILLVIPACAIWYLIGIKRLVSRVAALVLVLLALAIVVPNCQVDHALLLSRDVAEFNDHIARLLDDGQAILASRKIHKFTHVVEEHPNEPEVRREWVRRLIQYSTTNMTEISEQHGAQISSEGPPSAPPNESSP